MEEVHNLNGFWKIMVGTLPDPGSAISQNRDAVGSIDASARMTRRANAEGCGSRSSVAALSIAAE